MKKFHELAEEPVPETLYRAFADLQRQLDFTSALSDYRTNSGNARFMVALSGGPDSCALLLGLKTLLATGRIEAEIIAAHVNHGTRGAESDADEAFCRELCRELEVELYVSAVTTVRKDEATLRKERYAQLTSACRDADALTLLTAHTLDDQVETVLFRLFRGTALAGMSGIPVLRKLDEQLLLWRPLLSARRQDCLQFLSNANIEARTDSSNDDVAYARNYIRKVILPAVEQRFPGATERIERTRKILQEDENELAEAERELFQIHNAQGWDVHELRGKSCAMQRRLSVRLLEQYGIEPSYARVEMLQSMINSDAPARFSLTQRWDVRIDEGYMKWVDKESLAHSLSAPEIPSYDIRIPGLSMLHRFNLCVRVEKLDHTCVSGFPGSQEMRILADLTKLKGKLRIRARQPGDSIEPLGMSCPVRLKKYLHAKKSERLLRYLGHTLVFSDDQDVVWVPGCGMSSRIAVRTHDIWQIGISSITHGAGDFC